jgi:hypothetical protein
MYDEGIYISTPFLPRTEILRFLGISRETAGYGQDPMAEKIRKSYAMGVGVEESVGDGLVVVRYPPRGRGKIFLVGPARGCDVHAAAPHLATWTRRHAQQPFSFHHGDVLHRTAGPSTRDRPTCRLPCVVALRENARPCDATSPTELQRALVALCSAGTQNL